MIELSNDQQGAVEAFDAFSASDRIIFALLGYAGTGKSFTFGRMAKNMGGQVLMAAPTHKAINVIRRNLRANDVPFEVGYDRRNHIHGRPITGTTAQLLGLQPVISDNQTADGLEFGKSGSGILDQMVNVDWIVVDEVSMLSADHLALIEMKAMQRGAKVLIIGDPGQLPPVNAAPIDWEAIPDVAVLEQVMRQPDGSAISLLAQAIRRTEDWRSVTGPGVTHDENIGAAFLDALEAETGMSFDPAGNEEDRTVFIAYTNRIVDEVQELACQAVYGHGRYRFEPNQLVIAESRIEAEVMTYIPKYRRSYPRQGVAANNADELIVKEFGERGKWGVEVTLARADDPRSVFDAEYLTPEERANKSHPYNLAVRDAMAAAAALQAEWKTAGMPRDTGLDLRRKAAWGLAFDLKDRSVISFRHPFALTSHKSQGSTYKRAFVDAVDIERFDARGLYVAATRPREELVIG